MVDRGKVSPQVQNPAVQGSMGNTPCEAWPCGVPGWLELYRIQDSWIIPFDGSDASPTVCGQSRESKPKGEAVEKNFIRMFAI